MSKSLFALVLVCTLFISCKSTDRGALDVETLSKKLFDTVRDNDIEKSAFLLPDKGTFRKILVEQGQEPENYNEVYSDFSDLAATNFNQLQSQLNTWENTKFIKEAAVEAKVGKLPTTRVSVKFTDGTQPCKFEFTAVKFNNRWYYFGDIIWITKEA